MHIELLRGAALSDDEAAAIHAASASGKLVSNGAQP